MTISRTVGVVTLSRAVVRGGGRRARANGIVESVDARANGPSRGAGERERERGTIDLSVGGLDRSVDSIINHRDRRDDRSIGEGWIRARG